MTEQTFNEYISEAVLDAIIKYAVTESVELRIADIRADNTAHVFSKRHMRRMNTLFKRIGRRVSVRVITVAAAILLVMMNSALLSDYAVRGAVGGAVVTWFEKHVKFSGDEVSIAILWEPAYVPDGYIEVYRNQQDEGISMMLYADADDNILQFLYDGDDNSLSVNNEMVEYGQVMKNEIVYHTFTAASDEYASSVVWDMSERRFCVAGMLPIEELLKIAQSVQ